MGCTKKGNSYTIGKRVNSLKQTVYVDVLLAVNFFTNYFLMLSAGKILRTAISRTRICLAAAFGAAAALSIFLPQMNVVISCLYKLAVSAGMVLIAYPWQNIRQFGRSMLITCAVTFGFGGTMFALWLAVSPTGMYYRNGIIYFNISPEFIIAVTILCYTVITVAGRICLRLEQLSKHYDATISNEGRAVRLRLMSDTGNCLTEPFTGYPVIVVKRSSVTKILPAHFMEYAAADKAKSTVDAPQNFRVIPYSTVGGGGFMTAFRPDNIKIFDKDNSYALKCCYIAVSEGFENEEYDGIINPKILNE